MQSRSTTRSGTYRSLTTYSDGTPTSPNIQDVPSHVRDTFSFSGFGSNDKRRRKVPTAGSYDKRYYRLYDGTRSVYNYKLNGSTTWSRVQEEGAFDFSNTPQFISSPYLTPGYRNDVYNSALEKLYDEIRKTELNLAVDIAEFRETARMIRSASEAVAHCLALAAGLADEVSDTIRWLRKVKRKIVTNPSKVASEVWLAYKYGWSPFYNTIYGLIDFTSRHFDEMQFKGRASMKQPVSIGSALLGSNLIVRGFQQYKAEVSVTCKVSDTLAFDRSRITSLNPVSIAWELVPFSFVFDWFYDVGGYLALQEAALGTGLTFVDGYATQVYVHKITEEYRGLTDVPLFWPDARRTEWYMQAEEYRALKQRVRLTAFPRPMAPRLKCSLGSSRIASAGALIRTTLLGKVK